MISLDSSRAGDQVARTVVARSAIAGWLSAVGESINALVFPWSCALCGEEGTSGPLCSSCRRTVLERSAVSADASCPRCALPVGPFADLQGGCGECRGRSLGFDAAIALGLYEGALKDLCLRLKHERNAWLAPWLGELLVDGRSAAVHSLPADAWVVPVPLHWWRHWRRGYNQSDALAGGLARRLGLSVHRPLRRVQATPKLALLGPTERAELLQKAFRARSNRKLSGRTVLLVDDVLTTGATCGAAARALKRAGAARVIAVVIARADKN